MTESAADDSEALKELAIGIGHLASKAELASRMLAASIQGELALRAARTANRLASVSIVAQKVDAEVSLAALLQVIEEVSICTKFAVHDSHVRDVSLLMRAIERPISQGELSTAEALEGAHAALAIIEAIEGTFSDLLGSVDSYKPSVITPWRHAVICWGLICSSLWIFRWPDRGRYLEEIGEHLFELSNPWKRLCFTLSLLFGLPRTAWNLRGM